MQGTGVRVLVVDDEPSLLDAVSTTLRYEGFSVSTADNGHDALSLVERDNPALVVLDVMMPGLDGLEVCRRMRRDGRDIPVLFLTARASITDRVAGLTIGGDDYLVKPFALAELVARVHTLLRRARQPSVAPVVLRFADVELVESTHEVRRGEVPVQLTATEFRLLHFLMAHPRQVLSKSKILDHVWEYDFDGNANVVETYVKYLRRKLDALGPPLIETIRLVGYRLREPA